MPVCSIVKVLPLSDVDDLMLPSAPSGNSSDLSLNMHEITVCYYPEMLSRLGVNYFENVINYLQLHWKLFN